MRSLFRMIETSFDSLILHADEEDIVVLGSGLAKSLNAQTGDWLTLMTTTAHGALNAVDLKVVGTMSGYSPEYDARAILLPLRTAQYLLDTEKVHKILVVIDETEKTDQLYGQIHALAEQKGYPVTLKKWHEQAVYYNKVKQFYRQMIGFISVVLFLIVFFSTSNTVVMTIVERTREIGTLLSIGTSRWQTIKTFFFEGMFIGIFGGIFSMVFAFSFSLLINHLNIQLPPPPGLTDGYPLMIRSTPDVYASIFLVTVFIAAVSSIVPAFRVTRMKIVDALGHI
jgi:putative ABC transport system permease protein